MLAPLQDLMRRVALLEERRGPDFAVAQITAVASQEPVGGTPSDDMAVEQSRYYNRWSCDVQMLDGEFRPNGGVIRNVPVLQSHLSVDGTMGGALEMANLSHTHEAEVASSHADVNVEAALENVNLNHRHDIIPVPLGVADIVLLASARLGAGMYWVVIGKLDYGALEAIIEHRASL